MLVNVVAFVPRVATRDRYDGAVLSVVISLVIGMLFMYLFTYAISKYPQQGLPEILETFAPGWLKNGLLIFFSCFWYLAGLITLFAFADYTRMFLNPDISFPVITCLYLAIVCFICSLRTIKVLYMIEILHVLGVPLIVFILFRSFLNREIRWDSIAAVALYITKWPLWTDIAALSYIYSGYANLAIFNRFLQPFQVKKLWPICVIGMIISCTSVIIPIGFLGSDAVGDYVFPWISTSDSMLIELGFIERVMFIFIFLCGFIVFANLIVSWHVSLEMLLSAIPLGNMSKQTQKWKKLGIVLIFCIGTLAAVFWINDQRLFYLGELWLDIRLPAEIFLVAIMVYAARRLKS